MLQITSPHMSYNIEQYPIDELLGPLNEVEAKNAPRMLFICGNKGLLKISPKVSIVGSRKASEDGLKRAALLSRILVEHGMLIVSGLAEGIDTAAHTAAIEAGGKTIAVLGTSLSEFYPAKNRELQERIMREHLAVSQFVVGTPSKPGNFPMRNRTMALVSDATVIVEAKDNSGSLHQGWEALRLGRPLFIMESILNNKDLKWPGEMLKYGAETLSRGNLDLLVDSVPRSPRDERIELSL